jgi:5-methylcytosine-specific restriction endonuclease McrA
MPTLGKNGSRRAEAVEGRVRRKQPARHALSREVRKAVFKRSGYRCRICGLGVAEGGVLEVDHKTPVSRGGTNDPANLQALCRECNRRKGSGQEPDSYIR